MKIVSTVNLKQQLERLQQQFPNDEIIEREKLMNITEEDKKTINILITHDSRLDESLLEEMPNLKWIAWFAAGVNKLPLKYIQSKGILLTNAKGIHQIPIAEYIFAYIMADFKKLYEFHQHQQERGFKTLLRQRELFGTTIAFLGTGKIASNAARIAQSFGMKTIGINTNGRAVTYFESTYAVIDRQSAFKEADIIVNVLPETDTTKHLITSDDFKAMGEDALFINVGRGTIVEERILLEALQSGTIRRAALDVFETEPLDKNNPLYDLPVNEVIMTPHITGVSPKYNERATSQFIKNYKIGLNEVEKWQNIINFDKGY